MADVPDKVIDRITKLLRLADGVGNEACTARRLAEKLQDRWGVEVEIVEDEAIGDVKSYEVLEHCVMYESALASAVSRLFDCKSYVTYDRVRSGWYVWLDGPKGAVRRAWARLCVLRNRIETILIRRAPFHSRRHALALGAARYVIFLVDEHLEGAEEKDLPLGQIDPHQRPEDAATEPIAPPGTRALVRYREKVKRRSCAHGPEGKPLPVPDFELPEHDQRMGAKYAHEGALADWVYETPPFFLEPIRRIGTGGVCLANAGYQTVVDLLLMTRSDLLSVRGIGPHKAAAVQACLRRHGVEFRPENVFPKPRRRAAFDSCAQTEG